MSSVHDFARALYVVAFIFVVIVVRKLKQAYTGPLRRIPGPLLARFTRLYELNETRRGNWEQVNVKLHRKYGPIVRIAPNRFSFSDPSVIRPIYGIGSKFYKSDFYSTFGPDTLEHRDIFSEMNNAKHAIGRRKCASMYAMSSLVSYEPFVNEVNAELDARLSKFAAEGESFDLFTWMQFYAFDVIGEITMGTSFGLLEAGWDKDGLLAAVDRANVQYGPQIGLIPELHPWYLRWVKLFRDDNREDHWMRIARPVIKLSKARQAGTAPTDRMDFMAKCVCLMKENTLEQRDILNIIATNIGAGSDTTGISLTAIIYYLIKNPQCMRKLRAEIREAEQQGALSKPVSFEEGQKLRYLQAVIKEALRLHPAVGTILPRVVPEGGATLAGQAFPPGTVVGVNPWSIHNDSAIWGDDVYMFKPERWLVEKHLLADLDKNFLAFGTGSRSCIGRNISMLEMCKMLPQILNRFDFRPATSDDWKVRSGWFVKQRFEVFVERRNDKEL